jgi:hypothetical protein
MRALAPLALVALLAASSGANLIDSGDGTGNTTAPPGDRGWSHVGVNEWNLTAFYLGNGWVITANHAGSGDLTLDGVLYPELPNTRVWFENDPFPARPDLVVYRLDPAAGLPPLPPFPILDREPLPGEELTLAGNGVARGSATTWNGYGGWNWGGPRVLRWGTNVVFEVGFWMTVGSSYTHSFDSDFTSIASGGTEHEAQGVIGDSGGAVLLKQGVAWVLAGIQYARIPHPGQPADTSLYGNLTLNVDLSFYRDQILAAIGCASPDDDGDGIGNGCDNCTQVENANQFDADGDWIGNACDADYDGNGVVGGSDVLALRASLGSFEGDPEYDPIVDSDADGSIGAAESSLVRAQFGGPPGPSGLLP